MGKFNFTVDAIRSLEPPEKGFVWHHDFGGAQSVKGLALRVFPTGRKAFYHYRWVNGKAQQTKMGDFPDLKIDQARKMAEDMNGDIHRGGDPVAERAAARAEWTLADLVDWYEKNHGAAKKSGGRDRRQLELYFPELLAVKLSHITRETVRELHARRGANPDDRVKNKPRTYAANRALAVLRSMFARAIEDEVFAGINPAESVKFHPEQSRSRRLKPGEMGRFFAAVDAAPELMRDYVMLSLLTGARRSNVLAMRWDQLDLDEGEWHIPMTKNGEAQTIPLEAQEVEILKRRQECVRGDWVFPGRSDGSTGHLAKPERGWKAILKAAEIEDLRLHDLRRSLGSWMRRTGAQLDEIGKTLGHKSPAATLVYARLEMDTVRAAKRTAHAAIEAARRG